MAHEGFNKQQERYYNEVLSSDYYLGGKDFRGEKFEDLKVEAEGAGRDGTVFTFRNPTSVSNPKRDENPISVSNPIAGGDPRTVKRVPWDKLKMCSKTKLREVGGSSGFFYKDCSRAAPATSRKAMSMPVGR